MKKFIIIDGHNFIFRAFYAFFQMLDESDPKNAVFGFSSMLFNVIQYEKPDYLALTFDKSKSFRHDLKEDYKGTRADTPDALRSQIPKIYDLVDAMGIPHFHVNGFEADDAIATLAKRAITHDEDLQVIILSGDMDLLQLVDTRIVVAVPSKTDGMKHMNAAAVQEKYSITPQQIPDYKGLVGDTSDNIKGVQGIGPKTAIQLLQSYHTLEGIYEHLNEIKGSAKEKLEKGREDAFHAKHMTTLVCDVPFDLSLDLVKFHGIDPKILEVFENYKFPFLLKKVAPYLRGATQVFNDAQDIFGTPEPVKPTKDHEQLSLF